MDNGIAKVTWTRPGGEVTGIRYGGVKNLLETQNKETNRGYWDVVWARYKNESSVFGLYGSNFSIIQQDENQTEISFSTRWNSAEWNSSAAAHPSLPINLDKRYIMRRGCPGFYSYLILEREAGWPQYNINQIRAVFKLNGQRFRHLAVSDDMQTIMPTAEERAIGQRLDYKEAVLLSKSSDTNPLVKVDDKYQFSTDYKDNQVHGWTSHDPPVGFWMIIPSNEFRTAGPVKQDLTSHTGPTTLGSFHSSHYSGLDVVIAFEDGEPWKMVYGPFYIYLNSANQNDDPFLLWIDAKNQMLEEVKSWPYEFVSSEDFPKGDQRGSVKGRLLVRDSCNANDTLIPGGSAWIGLAAPGNAGSWQCEAKGYQFWTNSDGDGYFEIRGVREGTYNLYAWVPGILGDYKYASDISITPGSVTVMGDLIFQTLRSGCTLWEIGLPERTAAEFFVPSAASKFSNQVFESQAMRYKQYGLWSRYDELYPYNDVEYIVGTSDYTQDWFFAHVTRQVNDSYVGTTWQIKFTLEHVVPYSRYTLRISVAAATRASLQVRFNVAPGGHPPHFSTGMFGSDNAIARHGIHGLNWLFSIEVYSGLLYRGENTVYLTLARATSPFQGLMYDYIRLEAPPETTT
ncbi:hypothetical protein Dimus_017531 [Dionaea muscipula]